MLHNLQRFSGRHFVEGLGQFFPTGVPRHPGVPFTILRGAAS